MSDDSFGGAVAFLFILYFICAGAALPLLMWDNSRMLSDCAAKHNVFECHWITQPGPAPKEAPQ